MYVVEGALVGIVWSGVWLRKNAAKAPPDHPQNAPRITPKSPHDLSARSSRVGDFKSKSQKENEDMGGVAHATGHGRRFTCQRSTLIQVYKSDRVVYG